LYETRDETIRNEMNRNRKIKPSRTTILFVEMQQKQFEREREKEMRCSRQMMCAESKRGRNSTVCI
jgi:hypothetical protein